MAVKNAEPYLSSCLDSIIGQSYTDWELLAVNDGSTDDSEQTLSSYSDKDSRIKRFDNKGTGIIAALRLAYSSSKGLYITRMDADDLMTPDKLEKMVAKQIERPHCLSIGKVAYFSDDGPLGDGYKRYADWLNELTETESNYSEIYKECSIPSPNWMTSRASLDRVKAFIPNTYPEDYDLAFRFRRARIRINNVMSITHYWRDHPTRTSRTSKVYLDNNYLPIKMKYFLAEDYKNNDLFLWGAGRKGKAVARLLIEQKINFHWVTDNPKKKGHMIYGQLIKSADLVGTYKFAQVIVAISQRDSEETIHRKLKGKDEKLVFRFC